MKTKGITEVYNQHKISAGVLRLFWTFAEYNEEGDLMLKISLDSEPMNFYSLKRLQQFVESLRPNTYAEIDLFTAKNYGTRVFSCVVDGNTGAVSNAEQVSELSSLGNTQETPVAPAPELSPAVLQAEGQRQEVVDSVSYQKFAQIFREDLQRQEQLKRLGELEKENSYLRQQLKDQSDLMEELRSYQKKAAYMQTVTDIGAAVLKGLLAKNAAKIGKGVQKLAGIPAEAVESILAEKDDQTTEAEAMVDNQTTEAEAMVDNIVKNQTEQQW